MPPIARPLVLALLACLALAPSASASPRQLSIMMDDDLLLYGNDDVAARTLVTMKSLGVDTVRVTVLWRVVADGANPSSREIRRLEGRARSRARRQRERFDGKDPATYPERNWDRFDNLVRGAAREGIQVLFNVTGPGPSWAHRTPPKHLRRLRATYKPKIREFKKFVMAVGRRYDGTYRDENADRGTLPRVSMWSLWNEPNQGGWLTPQWEPRGRHRIRVAASAIHLRKLYQYAYSGLMATGHRADNDTILLGETAPWGSSRRTTTSAIGPKRFLREVFCLKSDGRPYRGRSAARRDCDDFERKGALRASGFAHHPYTKNQSPTVRSSRRDALTMANIGELGTLLDQIASRTSRLPAGLPLYMTEFGFETKPPDKHYGVTLARQRAWNVLGEHLAYRDPRIASQAQFLLVDAAPRRRHTKGSKHYWRTYQSGLFFRNGKSKPAAYAYSLPFLVFARGSDATGAKAVRIWGQLRFLPNGAPGSAEIQWRPKDDRTPWTTVGSPVAADAARGYFEADRVAPSPAAGEWRIVWRNPTGGPGFATAGIDSP